MRIAIFSDTFPPQINGVAHVISQSAMRLARHGHDVHLLTASQGSREYLDGISQGMYAIHNVRSLPSGVYPDLRFTVPLATTMLQLKGWQPDIVHTHTPFGVGWAAVRCAKRFGVPLIGTHHTFFDDYLKHVRLDSKLTRNMSWKLTVAYFNQCDLVLSPSHSLAGEMTENGLETPVRILPNPIDTELFTPEATRRVPGRSLVYMGRLSFEKSLDQVLTAFCTVRHKMPGATLTLIGDGPERADLEEMAVDLGIDSDVCFTGILRGEELARKLRSMDVFVTLSKTENIPLSVLEAMASGLPVVATAMRGLPEIVKDGVNGLLVPPDEPEVTARQVIRLLGDHEMLETYSRQACAFAQRFSQDRIMTEWVEIYRSALAGLP